MERKSNRNAMDKLERIIAKHRLSPEIAKELHDLWNEYLDVDETLVDQSKTVISTFNQDKTLDLVKENLYPPTRDKPTLLGDPEETLGSSRHNKIKVLLCYY